MPEHPARFDRSRIGDIPNPPFVLRHEPSALFATRAARFRFLARSSELAPYLLFLGELSELQAALARELPGPIALPAERIAVALGPVATGTCPTCGGRPICSSVLGLGDIDDLRYASCAGCATQWHEARIKCLCCGSIKGISYRSAETGDATVKAEVCSECGYWVKALFQGRNACLEPVADDVGSLGLDLLMHGTPFRRGGFNPFLAGY